MANEERTTRRLRCSSATNCIDVALGNDIVLVRDTKDRQGGVLAFDHAAWQRFVNWVRP